MLVKMLLAKTPARRPLEGAWPRLRSAAPPRLMVGPSQPGGDVAALKISGPTSGYSRSRPSGDGESGSGPTMRRRWVALVIAT